jgi:hypothetical protein
MRFQVLKSTTTSSYLIVKPSTDHHKNFSLQCSSGTDDHDGMNGIRPGPVRARDRAQPCRRYIEGSRGLGSSCYDAAFKTIFFKLTPGPFGLYGHHSSESSDAVQQAAARLPRPGCGRGGQLGNLNLMTGVTVRSVLPGS